MTEEQKAKKRERNRLWAQKKALEKKQAQPQDVAEPNQAEQPENVPAQNPCAEPENAPEQHTEPPHLTIDYLVSVEMQRYARAKGNIPKLLEAILTELVTIRVSKC